MFVTHLLLLLNMPMVAKRIEPTKSGQISAGLIPFAGSQTKQFNTKTKVTTYTTNGVIGDYLNKIGLRTPEVSIKTTTYPTNNTAIIETRER